MSSKILTLLQTSSISDHDKFMVRTLLPVMKPAVIKQIEDALQKEFSRIGKLDEKQKRIELKYNVMVEKLVEMENKK